MFWRFILLKCLTCSSPTATLWLPTYTCMCVSDAFILPLTLVVNTHVLWLTCDVLILNVMQASQSILTISVQISVSGDVFSLKTLHKRDNSSARSPAVTVCIKLLGLCCQSILSSCCVSRLQAKSDRGFPVWFSISSCFPGQLTGPAYLVS